PRPARATAPRRGGLRAYVGLRRLDRGLYEARRAQRFSRRDLDRGAARPTSQIRRERAPEGGLLPAWPRPGRDRRRGTGPGWSAGVQQHPGRLRWTRARDGLRPTG